jgi:hypothetical protein
MSATAENLIRDLSARGVRLARHGDRLHVEAPTGTLTPELRETIAEAKPAILAALDADDAYTLSGDALRSFVRAQRDAELRSHGKVPPDETATAQCVRCGPIFIAPEVASVLPNIGGVPTAAGCPWCSNRKSGLPIPRPEQKSNNEGPR